jgi:ubiquinone/menaquinone biosynthesis C-methylase UbiE
MTNAAKPLQQRIFSRLWRQPWFRREFYNLLGLFFRKKTQWQMMNCGFVPEVQAERWPGEYEAERYSYELYAQLVAGTAIEGRDVLELGAGRGGGARFLHAMMKPRRLVGMDYASSAVRWCRKNFGKPGLEFVCGDANRMPFEAGAFDVIVAVEVTHCLVEKGAFLREAARVLRRGGRLLIADFFYLRADAMHALEKFDRAVADSMFNRVAMDDWTRGVVAAIEADSARRAAEIQASVPVFLRETSLGFTSTTASSTYVALCAGRTVYRRYVLERRNE